VRRGEDWGGGGQVGMGYLQEELNRQGDDEQNGDEHWTHRIIPSRGVSVSDLVVSPDEGVQRIEDKDKGDREQDESIDLCTAYSQVRGRQAVRMVRRLTVTCGEG
jgi:hypothetical protein